MCSGEWTYEDNIGRLEARVIEKIVERICVDSGVCIEGLRFLIVGDNMSVVLSVSRFRTRGFNF